jgi:uncharacterized membrane protein YkvA (DUF1232 family)
MFRGDFRTRMLLHLPHFIKLYWRLFTDKRVSVIPKIVLIAGVIYFVVPWDIIPDFPMVGLGQLDDLGVLMLALQLFIRLAPRRIVEEQVQLIDEGL